MTRQRWLMLLGALLIVYTLVGCGSPAATPTKPPVTVPPAVTVLVITATPPPATPTRVEPTLTPAPVASATTAVTPTAAVKATTAGVARATVTRTPTKAPAQPTAVPQKFTAPRLISPIFVNEQGAQKDERHYPVDALTFMWNSVGGLNSDECYWLRVEFVPVNPGSGVAARGDDFLVWCGDQTGAGFLVGKDDSPVGSFTLFQPGRGTPNYGALISDTSEMWVTWSVTVVKDLGVKADKVHHNVAPISPRSLIVQFLLKG